MLWILPGFLGQENDFEFVNENYQFIPLFKKQHPLRLCKDKNQWIVKFVEHVKSQNHSMNILLGYSFGARLALEIIKKMPGVFDHCILISCNPLNLDSEERKLRALNDKKWAKKFTSLNWDQALKLWNQQSVLNNSAKPQNRDQNYYSLESLELGLIEYSLANQFIEPSDLAAFKGSILWLFGELDTKFINISKKLQKNGWNGEFLHIESAGHRLHLDNTESFLSCIGEFLANKKEML